MKAGMVVTAEFQGVVSTKRRPAVVVSSDTYHQERPDAILAVVTSQISKYKFFDRLCFTRLAIGIFEQAISRADFSFHLTAK